MSSLELMERREAGIAELVAYLGEKSKGFTEPRLVVIGGYALRAFVPFARYSRDCDFVLKDGLETVQRWKPTGVALEEFRHERDHGFMRWSKAIALARKSVRLGIDFMEGQVRGRAGEAFAIDDRFLSGCKGVELQMGDRTCAVRVPAYADFFVLKVMAARKSDVRDIAAMVWKNGVPEAGEALSGLNEGSVFTQNLARKVIPEVESKFFMDSWKGMFVTSAFAEQDRRNVAAALRGLLESDKR